MTATDDQMKSLVGCMGEQIESQQANITQLQRTLQVKPHITMDTYFMHFFNCSGNVGGVQWYECC